LISQRVLEIVSFKMSRSTMDAKPRGSAKDADDS